MKTAKALVLDPSRDGRSQSLGGRFWDHVDREGACWVWTGYRNAKGYGCYGVSGGKCVLAHRASWSMANGPIPARMLVLHSRECVSRACVRPSHLRLGTQLENMADMVATGRQNKAKGERCAAAVLNSEQVKEIRRRGAAGEPSAALATQFGVNYTAIRKILRRDTWRHIP